VSDAGAMIAPTTSALPSRPAQDWRLLVVVFWLTSMVEGLGVSQIYALLPAYLTKMGVPHDERLAFVGLFSALIFVVGMPLVPLWGVWADKYSRKAVIVRSCLVEAVVFACVALSREPWQLALSMLLIGFQLGNTGVMLAGIRDVTPLRRLGVTIASSGSRRCSRSGRRASSGSAPARFGPPWSRPAVSSSWPCGRSGERCRTQPSGVCSSSSGSPTSGRR